MDLTLLPYSGYHFDTPCRFPFICCMVFALNQSNPKGIGLKTLLSNLGFQIWLKFYDTNWFVYFTVIWVKNWKISDQSCNDDWKWTKYEDKESSDSENVLKMNRKILCQFKNSLKIFEDCKFFKYLQSYEDFQRKMVNFCHLEMSLCPYLEQNFMDFFDGNYSIHFFEQCT